MKEEKKEPTLAQKLLFSRIKFMELLIEYGIDEEDNESFQQAQELAQQLIDAGH
jgi:hypothetical protein